MSSAADSQAFEMSLRDQLIAAQNNHAPPQPQQPHQHAQPTNSYNAHQSHQQSIHHHHNPAMAIQPYGMTHESPDLSLPHTDPADPNTQGAAAGKKGRAQRELSNTKRAAQNRAAQRAFRLRKEQHINKLEDDLKQYLVMEENFKTLQRENGALRDYITLLQSKMTEKNISFPPTPDQGPMRAASLSAPDNQPIHQDHDPVYHPAPVQQPAHHDQHDHHEQHRYPDPSPSQSHAAPSNVYPPPSHDQQHHQHDPAIHTQPAPQDAASDSLPAAAISQLQAAAAQAGSMNRPPSPPPTHHGQHRQPHPQDPQYVRASEYPAHKRLRLDSPPHQTRGFIDFTEIGKQSEFSDNFDELFDDKVAPAVLIKDGGIDLASGALVINHQCDSLADWAL
ncbi:hypothetical protein E4T49_04682 [Aureobasidium sp. EXF-10728]|nr:hypothetical protein E4T49_04682 [Aureobasidium sp. EXF-10728]